MPGLKPAQLTIRSCAEGDLAVTCICAHYVAHGPSTIELVSLDDAEVARRGPAIQSGSLPWIVASLDNGRLVGHAYAIVCRPCIIGHRFTVEDFVYVDPTHAGWVICGLLLTRRIEG